MFRRVEVRVSAHDGNGRVVARAESVVLQRRFEDRARDPLGGGLGFVRMEVEDRRVPAPGGGERIATLALPDTTRGLRVKYSVVYQRMSTPMAEAFGVSQVLDEVLIASGELAPSVLVSTLGGAR